MMDLILGIAGMLFILIGFILDEFYKRFNENTVGYNVLNMLGSGLLTYYAYTLNSWPFMILNTVWFIAALVKLIWIEEKPKKKK